MNLIGINGYIGSGKDTVGQIIQYWDCKDRYNFDYPFEEFIAFEHSNWQIKKFAYKLKQIASILTGIPQEKFEDREFKKTFLPEEWKKYIGFVQGENHWEEMTVREFLQKLGTESVREKLHPNTWVNALFADYKDDIIISKGEARRWGTKWEVPSKSTAYEPYLVGWDDREYLTTKYPNWIITDTRFPNEAQAIKDRGGFVIRINREYYEYDDAGFHIWSDREDKMGWLMKLSAGRYTKEQALKLFREEKSRELHSSETALDNWDFDYVIDNNGSMEELTEKVKKMMVGFKIT